VGGGLKSLEGLYRREGCVHVMEVEVAHYFCITGGSRPAKSLPPPLPSADGFWGPSSTSIINVCVCIERRDLYRS
jgi:hypothetical protein